MNDPIEEARKAIEREEYERASLLLRPLAMAVSWHFSESQEVAPAPSISLRATRDDTYAKRKHG
jgi:hypothetical protein